MGPMRQQVGDVIDGFVLEECLHRTVMSSLWRVARPEAGGGQPRLVMKIPSFQPGDDASAIVGFELEQMILPRLSGPHAPRFVAAGDFTRVPYVVMEWVDGESLLAIARKAPVPAERVAEIGARIARALQDLHRQHVIHLDLKPANILLRPSGEAVFIDFGLSRHDELPDLLGEESDVPMGTSPYISPEQVLGVRSEPKSDHFALGCILYELATGKQPFGDPSGKAGMMRRFWRDPVPPRALAPDCPPWLQDVILRCLSVDPSRRFASAAQLAFALENPEKVELTWRAAKLHRDGFWTVLRRRLATRRSAARPQARIAAQLDSAPIILAAVDLQPGQDELALSLRTHAERTFTAEPGARLVCVTVLKTALLSLDDSAPRNGGNAYVQRLVELQDWARGLKVPTDAISFHVLEAVDPAAALIEYARKNQVDHIVIGARGSSALRRYLGSVSSQVVAESPCTVTVVRLHD
jgi:eukaryotic-like serine/threonine-protein kinase